MLQRLRLRLVLVVVLLLAFLNLMSSEEEDEEEDEVPWRFAHTGGYKPIEKDPFLVRPSLGAGLSKTRICDIVIPNPESL
jgi:hypothetical protein